MRSTGSAVSAPLALAEPQLQVEDRQQPERLQGEPVRGLGRTVSGAPPGRRRPEPAARRAGRRPRRRRRPAAPACRARPPGPGSRSPRPGRRCPRRAAAATGSSRCGRGPVDARRRPRPACASRVGVVDAGATAHHVGGAQAEQQPRPGSRRPWCCRCPCRRGPAGRQPASISSSATAAPARQRGLDLGRRSARPRGRWHPSRGAPCADAPRPGVPARSSSTPRSSTRTRAPCARASTLTAAPPRRNSRTISAVTSPGVRRDRRSHRSYAVVAGEHHHRDLRRAAAGGPCPGRRPARPRGPRGGPGRRVASPARRAAARACGPRRLVDRRRTIVMRVLSFSRCTRPATTRRTSSVTVGQPLVEPAQGVAEQHAGPRAGHHAAADLVADRHHRHRRRAPRLHQALHLGVEPLAATPCRRPPSPTRRPRPSPRPARWPGSRRAPARRRPASTPATSVGLPGGPAGGPVAPVGGHPGGPVGVGAVGHRPRRDVENVGPVGQQPLRVPGLARPRAAEHQRPAHRYGVGYDDRGARATLRQRRAQCGDETGADLGVGVHGDPDVPPVEPRERRRPPHRDAVLEQPHPQPVVLPAQQQEVGRGRPHPERERGQVVEEAGTGTRDRVRALSPFVLGAHEQRGGADGRGAHRPRLAERTKPAGQLRPGEQVAHPQPGQPPQLGEAAHAHEPRDPRGVRARGVGQEVGERLVHDQHPARPGQGGRAPPPARGVRSGCPAGPARPGPPRRAPRRGRVRSRRRRRGRPGARAPRRSEAPPRGR